MMLEEIAARAHQQILSNGGCTINLQGAEPTSGYAFSPYPELERVLPSSGLSPQFILQYLKDNEHALAQPGNHLGAWNDQQSGNVFLDVSHIGPPTKDTIDEAKKANQIAVFDLANANEIPTGVKRDVSITSAWDESAFKTAIRWNITPDQRALNRYHDRKQMMKENLQVRTADELANIWDNAFKLGVAPQAVHINHAYGPEGHRSWHSAGPTDAHQSWPAYSPNLNHALRTFGDEWMNKWHQDYQATKRKQFIDNPDTMSHEYEDWTDWYAQHAPQHFDPHTVARTSAWGDKGQGADSWEDMFDDEDYDEGAWMPGHYPYLIHPEGVYFGMKGDSHPYMGPGEISRGYMDAKTGPTPEEFGEHYDNARQAWWEMRSPEYREWDRGRDAEFKRQREEWMAQNPGAGKHQYLLRNKWRDHTENHGPREEMEAEGYGPWRTLAPMPWSHPFPPEDWQHNVPKPQPPWRLNSKTAADHALTGEPMDEPDGGWDLWGGKGERDVLTGDCPYCKSPNTGSKIVNPLNSPDPYTRNQAKLKPELYKPWVTNNCHDCFATWSKPNPTVPDALPEPLTMMDTEPGSMTFPKHWAGWDWEAEPSEFAFPERPKFETTPEDHQASLLAGYRVIPHEPPEWQLRYSAVDPNWMQEWIAKNGPYLTHSTKPYLVPLIQRDGLLPHDTEGIGSKYSDELVPRANHVYLRHPYRIPNDGRAICVDMRKLDWNRINADEDHFVDFRSADKFGLPLAFARYGEDGTWVEDRQGRKYKHFGDYADQHKLNGPDHTAHSLNGGTAAVEGGIDPACFVTPQQMEADLRENWPHVLSNQQYNMGIVQTKVPYEQHQPALSQSPVSYPREGSSRPNLTNPWLSEWHVQSAWIPPEGFGVLGPQYPEEYDLMVHKPSRLKECPECHWLGKWSDSCPRCGFNELSVDPERLGNWSWT